MRILSSKDISSLLLKQSDSQLQHFHDVLAKALSEYQRSESQSSTSSTEIIQPPRTVMTTHQGITTLSMPATDTNFTSVKTVMVPPGGPIQGSINVYKATGELLGLLNAAEVTGFRTALNPMLALARSRWGRRLTDTEKDSNIGYNLVVFGGGKQAEWHTRLAMRFSSIKRVTIVNRSRQRLNEFTEMIFEDLKESYPTMIFESLSKENNSTYETQLHDILSQSDVICCTTPSTSPLFPAEYLQSSQKPRFISLIGSYKPTMQEVDTDTLLSGYEGKIIVDSIEACLEEAGELIKANVTKDKLVEIGAIYDEDYAAAISDAEISRLLSPETKNVIFKCVGLSLMDLVISKALLEMAGGVGVGRLIDEF